MKRAGIIIGLLVSLAAAGLPAGPIAAAKQWPNASGIWQESTGDHAYRVSIFHKGETLHAVGVGTYKGQKVVWYGHGTVKGAEIEYDYEFALAPEKWVPGHHSLTLSADGNTMSGTWKDERGSGGKLTRTRVR